jgi:uncharacterized membrane protein YdjX (TVP38/TMEM64 family)
LPQWLRPIVFLVLGAAAVGLWWAFRDRLTLDALTQREAVLRAFQREHWLAMYVSAFVAYVVVTALSIPAATVLSLTIGWLFGFAWGLPLVSFASAAGATLAFLLSRYLLRDFVRERFARWIPRVTEALERDGALYLFAMRLTPAVPFFVVNMVMGLTQLPARTFWWVSQLGMLPVTCLFVYAGSTVPDLEELAARGPQSIITVPLAMAFVLLGVFPFAARWAMSWLGIGNRE